MSEQLTRKQETLLAVTHRAAEGGNSWLAVSAQLSFDALAAAELAAASKIRVGGGVHVLKTPLAMRSNAAEAVIGQRRILAQQLPIELERTFLEGLPGTEHLEALPVPLTSMIRDARKHTLLENNDPEAAVAWLVNRATKLEALARDLTREQDQLRALYRAAIYRFHQSVISEALFYGDTTFATAMVKLAAAQHTTHALTEREWPTVPEALAAVAEIFALWSTPPPIAVG